MKLMPAPDAGFGRSPGLQFGGVKDGSIDPLGINRAMYSVSSGAALLRNLPAIKVLPSSNG